MQTVLHDRHVSLGAKMVSFAGWEMPIQYKGIVAEHHVVRKAVGLFDVSHMGQISIEGPDAEPLLNTLSTNRITGKSDLTATYTVWCHPTGGSVDDVIIYKKKQDKFFVIVNASNREKDLNHLLQYAKEHNLEVTIQDQYQQEGILALQGPLAEQLLSKFIPEIKSIKPMHFLPIQEEGQEIIISHTGYTGAGGFEIYAPNHLIIKWWDRLLQEGSQYGIEPIGLGARDTLRLEMGFALYGHELNDSISPNESVAAWTIKWDKEDFSGKKAIEQLEKSPHKRYAYGIKLIDKGVAREGYPIIKDDKQIGYVTSGTFSPTLNEAIALILVNEPLKLEDVVEVQIRQQRCRTKVVPIPFIRKEK